MNEIPGDQGGAIALLALAALLFATRLVLSIVVHSGMVLSRVALHRLTTDGPVRLEFLAQFREPGSTHRATVGIARSICLLGGFFLLIEASGRFALGSGVRAGLVAVTIVLVLLFDAAIAGLVAVWDPRNAIRRAAVIVPPLHALLYPLVLPLKGFVALFGRLQNPTDEEREEEQEEEVEALIEVGERDGIIEGAEGEMMRSIVDLDETCVREIMTPRTDIVALPANSSIEDARRVIIEAGHSRIPVFRDTLDNVVGVLHGRDLLRAWEAGVNSGSIDAHLREVIFVPEQMSVATLLGEMQVKTHIAMVVDEYGGVAGLITLEDLLEEIVGDIRDEHDREEAMIRAQPDGTWIINAASHVEELEDLFGVDCGNRDYDTVGGLVVSTLGRVPQEGESLEFQSLRITVTKADRRRIHQVRVTPPDAPETATAG